MPEATPQQLGTGLIIVAALFVLANQGLGVYHRLRQLGQHDHAAEPVSRAELSAAEKYTHERVHELRGLYNANFLKVALLEKALENGIKDRVTKLEGKVEQALNLLTRAQLILEHLEQARKEGAAGIPVS